MLNRRYIRIKVMQTLYALEQSKKANYELALESIAEYFTPAWNDEEGRANIEQLKALEKEACEVFKKAHEEKLTKIENVQHEKVRIASQKAIAYYNNQVVQDVRTLQKNLLNEAERIYNAYLSIILLLSDLREFALNQDTKINYDKGINVGNNTILEALLKHEVFQKKVLSKEISWNANRDLVKTLYRKLARNNEGYQVFLDKQAIPPEEKLHEDKALIDFILKNCLYESEEFNEHFEALDLNWEENQKIVKSMLNRTFKDMKDLEKVKNADFELSQIAKNWEDDKVFLEDLYEYNVDNEAKLYDIVKEKAKNWEMERLAVIDQIILKMAIAEMLYFFSIPVKVSINEYIEVSKQYSTPKSKQFINGLLDKTARYLKEKGDIKKSGRGLMDNK